MKNILYNARYFLILVGIIFITASFGVFSREKGDVTIWFNSHHTIELDHVFSIFSRLGEWVGVGLALIVLIVMRHRFWAIVLLISYAMNGLVVQLLKHLVFSEMDRPSKFLIGSFHQIDGLDVHRHLSFPSGHTNTALVVFLILTLAFYKKPWPGTVFGLLACMVGISRMYLYQHFLIDTMAGASIGILISCVVVYLLVVKSNLSQKHWIKYENRNN